MKVVMKKIILVLGVIVVGGLAFLYVFPVSRSQSLGGGGGEGSATSAIPVEVVTVRSREVPLYEELPGRIVAYEVAEIRPQVTGIIVERLFVEGNWVEQGQQLYQIDPAPYEAAYQSAEAALAKANANVKSIEAKADRYKELIKIDAVSRQDYDDIIAAFEQAKADVAIAEAALVSAQIDLDYTKAYASIAGQIGKSRFTKGALVTANQPQYLAKITQLDPIYADLVQPGAELRRMRQSFGGQEKVEVELYWEGRTNRYEALGRLQFADVTIDEGTGSGQLRALFPNPDGILLPGMFVRARMKVDNQEGILVPQRATTRGPDGKLSVWVVREDNTVEKRIIHARRAIQADWLATDGLTDGETIVLEGIQKVQPGSQVAPATEAASAPVFGESNDGKERS